MDIVCYQKGIIFILRNETHSEMPCTEQQKLLLGYTSQSAITIAKQALIDSGIATLFENLQKLSKILDEVLAANNGNNVRELCLVPRVK